MPGPLPNPSARRAGRAGLTFTTLPAGGRTQPAPPYPLPEREDGLQVRRAELWSALWRTPQAAMWARHLWTMPQARYVEALLAWEDDPAGVSGALLTEVRQMEGALALSPAGLLRVRAVIGEAGTAGMGTVRHLASVDLSDHATRAGAATVDLSPDVEPDVPRAPGPAC